MIKGDQDIKKVCSFYASDWHLITMLLPYINKKINEEIKIATILEQDAEEKVEVLLDKLNIKNKKLIKDIGWNEQVINEERIKKLIKENEENNLEIIIAGSNDYINKVHQIIDEFIEEQGKNIKIIDCYYIDEIKLDIREIVSKHEAILNTAGEKSKEEFLEGVQ